MQLSHGVDCMDQSLLYPMTVTLAPPHDHNADILDLSINATCLNQLLAAPSPSPDPEMRFLESADLDPGLSLSSCNGSDETNPSSMSSPSMHLTSNIWDQPFYPNPETTPEMTRHSMEFLFRILRTWPCMMARGVQLPPIFHPSQLAVKPLPLALVNCFTLAKMWYTMNEASSEIVRETIMKEMQVLLADVNLLNHHKGSLADIALVLDL
jgi:hypothetical protein